MRRGPGRSKVWMKTLGNREYDDMHFRKYFLVVCWLMLSFLSACGAGSKNEPERQVMAKVNGDLITARDFNDQFSRIEFRAGPDKKVGKRQILNALVDEKLLAQRASEGGLDREPDTIVALDRARRQVLAQAAIDHESGGGRASYRETKAFYEDHPELFARRKTYVFRRFDLLARELKPSVKADLDKSASPAEVGSILKRANIGFGDQTEIYAAEMLPTDVLKQVAEMKRGDILMFKEGRQIVLMQLTSSIADPIDLARATPAIRTYLAASRRKVATDSLLKDLRRSAKIEFYEEMIDRFQVQADARSFEPKENAPVGRNATQVSTVSSSR